LLAGSIPFRRQSRKHGNRERKLKRKHSTVVPTPFSLGDWPDDNSLIFLSFRRFFATIRTAKFCGKKRQKVWCGASSSPPRGAPPSHA